MASFDQVKAEGVNRWIYSGKVSKKNFKYSVNGNAMFSCMLIVPAMKEKFATRVWVKAFKTLAEELNAAINDSDSVWFTGYLSNNSFTGADGKKVFKDDLIITKWEKATVAPWQKDADTASYAGSGEPKNSSEVPF